MPEGAVQIGGPKEAGGPVGVEAVGGFGGAGYGYTDETHTGSELDRNEHLLQERGGLGAKGFVLAPAFLLYDIAGVFGMTQDWAQGTDGAHEYDDGHLYEIDAGARLFAERFHPAGLTFTRFEDVQPRLFLSAIKSKTMTVEAQQDFNFEDGSVRFEYTRRMIEQTQFGAEDSSFFDVREDRAGVGGDYRIGRSQTLDGGYAYQEVRQYNVEGRDFNQHMAHAQHVWMFSESSEDVLRSRFEVSRQDGYLDQRLLRWDETLMGRLQERLDGDVQLHAERNETTLLDTTMFNGSAGLRHRLYDSLTSTLRIHGGRISTDDTSTDEAAGAQLGFDYSKKTAWGVYRCNYTNWIERRWVTNDAGGAIDERHTFPALPPEEVILDRRWVTLESIVVTDPSGLMYYEEGFDYTLVQDSAGQVRITRVVTGNIPIQGTILVDYTYEQGGDYTVDSMVQRLRTEHEFHNGLTPYFGLMRQDQDVFDVEDGAGIEAIRERSLVGGLEWRARPLLIGGEYENRESTVLPYDAVRMRGQYSALVGEGHQLTLHVGQSWFWYREPDYRLDITQGGARFRWNLGRHHSVFVDTILYRSDDSRVGNSLSYTAGGGYEIRWRQFALRLRGTHRETRGVTSDYRGDEFGIYLVREFGSPTSKVSSASDRFLRQ